MTYEVIFEEHNFYRLQFDDELEFKGWEDRGSCLDDLDSQNNIFQKSNHEITPTNDN